MNHPSRNLARRSSAPPRLLVAAVLALVAAGLLAAGCASVKTRPESELSATIRLRPPAQIFVQPFDTTFGMWEGETSSEAERTRVRDWLTARLETTLADLAPTYLLTGPMPSSGWLITGRFIRVDPGSKAQRVLVGWGAGRSALETRVSVYDLAVSSTEPIVSFATSGGSNLEAGAAAVFTNALEADIERTAREVRDFLQDRLGTAGGSRGPRATPERLEEIEMRPRR